MRYRALGKTGLKVSEIGLGAEWLERHNGDEVSEIIHYCADKGINILDCWMSNPEVRTNIGKAIEGSRDRWIIQGHLGSTWQNGQYVKSRDLKIAGEAFQDLLDRFHTDHIDLGMIHFVDEISEFHALMDGEFYAYAESLKVKGIIRHIGMSTHNPKVARLAAESGKIEMILFSVNPAFDMLPASEDLNDYFKDDYYRNTGGITPERAELYRICEENGVGITVMKGYAGGRLLDAEAWQDRWQTESPGGRRHGKERSLCKWCRKPGWNPEGGPDQSGRGRRAEDPDWCTELQHRSVSENRRLPQNRRSDRV